ncbi:hypothetical protein [Pontimicrobium aquaticum]|uniref:CarboxypepD_reg-like domain-containing protein n=1 Tax=Pontimicrobium aquaticum TaxID=2565367 RepID=A0A4U0EX97_9FLAO|nr:hypothetical protein [Pontimicrobium aquaticum]TJY36448.1 hypothetical protein E5167_07240 [Pontimicrobium aquaticum]
MIKTKRCFAVVFFFVMASLYSQTVQINGVVTGNTDVENIHVINKTANKFTTTNKLGAFTIEVKLSDTLVFSSVQYSLKAVMISPKIILEKKMTVFLKDKVNELDQVTVGKILTGSLDSDIKNSDAERPIDFYDVGIPGYTGKTKTQSERRLHEADAGKYVAIGLGVGLNLNKILNGITGRTKKLKERVRKEHNEGLLTSIKSNLSENFFITYPLDESLRTDFFYFCSEDENFEKRCRGKSDIEIFEFLAEKMVTYKANLRSKDD